MSCARLLACVVLAAAGCGPDPRADEPCSEVGDTLRCPHHTGKVAGDGLGRAVHFKAPPGRSPPPGGWPVVVLFQGSFDAAEWLWTGTKGDALGTDHQTATIRALLDAGFLVVTPEAHFGGFWFWDTNITPYGEAWEIAPDHQLMKNLFAALESGGFGEVNMGRLYAAGMSSGGYMTSRMAIAYPGRFRALAIHSASFATCSSFICAMPPKLPADHPPTLFLHGDADPIVPIGTMRDYRKLLDANGTENAELVDAKVGHRWLPEAPTAIRDFFLAH